MNVRLHFIVEGQTEETFVNRVLVPHLASYFIWVDVRCVMTSRRRTIIHRGGLTSYAKAKRDIILWMKEDQNPDAVFTTLFDLYALPNDSPDYLRAKTIKDPYERVAKLEKAMSRDIGESRFVPHIQLHEFEALLFTDPQKMDWLCPERHESIQNLVKVAANFESPELIDDGKDTAPSKRIIREIPEYRGMKPSAGPLTAEKIGLTLLHERCRHFGGWLDQLKALGGGGQIS